MLKQHINFEEMAEKIFEDEATPSCSSSSSVILKPDDDNYKALIEGLNSIQKVLQKYYNFKSFEINPQHRRNLGVHDRTAKNRRQINANNEVGSSYKTDLPPYLTEDLIGRIKKQQEAFGLPPVTNQSEFEELAIVAKHLKSFGHAEMNDPAPISASIWTAYEVLALDKETPEIEVDRQSSSEMESGGDLIEGSEPADDVLKLSVPLPPIGNHLKNSEKSNNKKLTADAENMMIDLQETEEESNELRSQLHTQILSAVSSSLFKAINIEDTEEL